MLALITGSGRLPEVLKAALSARAQDFLSCPIATDDATGNHAELGTLGTLIDDIKMRGVHEICLAGALDRYRLRIGRVDEMTKPIMPRIEKAMRLGDNAALVELLTIFEEHGLTPRGAHEICPELLPDAGVPTKARPSQQDEADAAQGDVALQAIGRADIGQACAVKAGKVLATEARAGTDAMLAGLTKPRIGADVGGILMKVPKPGQDRRADLPAVGPDTADGVAAARLGGIVIEAGGVLVIDLDETIEKCDQAGLFLWVREPKR